MGEYVIMVFGNSVLPELNNTHQPYLCMSGVAESGTCGFHGSAGPGTSIISERKNILTPRSTISE